MQELLEPGVENLCGNTRTGILGSDTSKWTILPNGRAGMRLPRQKGVEVFLALDGVCRLCRHGETRSAISKWKADPASLRPKTSCCDCQNCDGLTASRRAQVPEGWQPPS